jgi:ribosome-associated heat shock protein Hsp15
MEQNRDRKKKDSLEKVRLDKWLKVTRLFKTRSKAVEFCLARHVKLNGRAAKPSHMVRVGDTLSIQYPSRNRTFDVVALAEKPVSAADARELYLEHLPKVSEESAEMIKVYLKLDSQRRRERRGKGRPTKRERRDLEKMKRK